MELFERAGVAEVNEPVLRGQGVRAEAPPTSSMSLPAEGVGDAGEDIGEIEEEQDGASLEAAAGDGDDHRAEADDADDADDEPIESADPVTSAAAEPNDAKPLDALGDRALVTRAMAGDRGALSILLQRYKPIVMRHLQRYPVDDADRKDLLQEAMLQVVRKLHTFRGDAQFSTWLYRVTANAALMKMRSERRRRATSLDDANPEIEAQPMTLPGGEWAENAHARLEHCQLNVRLERALAELPQGYREVVIEHYIEGRPLQGVADNLGTTESAVRSRLHRARASLRRMLADLGAPMRGDGELRDVRDEAAA
jgi:RNA polymerase sigma-70 factor (ECF subfamily)